MSQYDCRHVVVRVSVSTTADNPRATVVHHTMAPFRRVNISCNLRRDPSTARESQPKHSHDAQRTATGKGPIILPKEFFFLALRAEPSCACPERSPNTPRLLNVHTRVVNYAPETSRSVTTALRCYRGPPSLPGDYAGFCAQGRRQRHLLSTIPDRRCKS